MLRVGGFSYGRKVGYEISKAGSPERKMVEEVFSKSY